jgi:FAD/FMN-containing dehydrogenase
LLRQQKTYIAHGNGRSYGDSSLHADLIHVRPYDNFLSFDNQNGSLHVQAGVLLDDILRVIVPKGWFLPVTPGTKYITMGGAIASDVHGKNHHSEGSFCRYVTEMTLMLASGEVLNCSRSENGDLFRATCGGMGLTGIILDATIRLKPIASSLIDQITIKTRNLQETLQAFEEYRDHTYSVAWLDCLAKGGDLGRGLVTVGEHAKTGGLEYAQTGKMSVPFDFPTLAVNKFTISAFNALYYSRATSNAVARPVSIDTFFYPLDGIENWNRVYGKNGFTQYQFVLPGQSSHDGLAEILERISASGKGSPLAVLKIMGKANENWLSFPSEGGTLALDFKIDRDLPRLFSELDDIVLRYQGRFYLSKDARISREVFEMGYGMIDRFREFRRQHEMDTKFCSLQSKRLGL